MAYYTQGNRHYYAAYSPYGIRTAYGRCNPASVFVFESREARDSFIETANYNYYEWHYEAITAREARRIAPDQHDHYVQQPDGSFVNYYGDEWRL